MSDPWRYRCPRNHCSWTRYGNEYVCERCKQNGDDYRFDELVDVKVHGVPETSA